MSIKSTLESLYKYDVYGVGKKPDLKKSVMSFIIQDIKLNSKLCHVIPA